MENQASVFSVSFKEIKRAHGSRNANDFKLSQEGWEKAPQENVPTEAPSKSTSTSGFGAGPTRSRGRATSG